MKKDRLEKIKKDCEQAKYDAHVAGQRDSARIRVKDFDELYEAAEMLQAISEDTDNPDKYFAEHNQLKERIAELEKEIRHLKLQIKMYKLGDDLDAPEINHIP